LAQKFVQRGYEAIQNAEVTQFSSFAGSLITLKLTREG
jgi:hypothetical protein